MKLIVGLGNPGREHQATRHNAGFWWVEDVARLERVALRFEGRFRGRVGRVSRDGHDCWLLEPQTYMNASGGSVAAFAGFYRIPTDEILVAHDELDLPPGTVRLKKGGGVAGHNGLKDLAAHIGVEFWRLRLGIGHPGDRAQVVDYVLHPPRAEEAELISDALKRSLEIWPLILASEMEKAMHRLHTRVEEAEEGKREESGSERPSASKKESDEPY